MARKIIFIILALLAIIIITTFFIIHNTNKLPIVAIASYGPHSSLSSSILGFKEQLAKEGFVSDKTVRYEIADVGFDPSLIPQMIANLKQYKPVVMLVLTTPVAQLAKGKIHNIPLIFSTITDPLAAGLLQKKDEPDNNMTGSAETQNLKAFLQFAKTILPKATRVGFLYCTSESNDVALLEMMREATKEYGMFLLAIPVEQARDIVIRMQEFRNKVDFIYVGTSGPIQPSLPVIANEAQKMQIPIFNAEEQAVKDGLALASFGVNYKAAGKNAGKLAAAILKGQDIKNLNPIYPTIADHYGAISKSKAHEFGVMIPSNIKLID